MNVDTQKSAVVLIEFQKLYLVCNIAECCRWDWK